MSPELASTRRTFLAGVAAAGVSLIHPHDLFATPQIERSPDPVAWLSPPKRWRLDGSSLTCTADPKTDFWRKTSYGYIADNGHFYYRLISGDFTTVVKVSGQYHDLYDQAGLMARIDAENWMKCGVEFVDGHQNMSIVYTRDFSSWGDWSLSFGHRKLVAQSRAQRSGARHLPFARRQ
jgi:regulation of enolase protein 1 (concanavalin A-like superfamily)